VTHAVFPNGAWKKFTNSSVISEFIITNTNPEVADILSGVRPFVVLDVQTHLCSELRINNPNIFTTVPKNMTNIFVATTNVAKLTAVYEASLKESSIFPNDHVFEVYSVDGISSDISEQPFGLSETSDGAMHRLLNCMSVIRNDNSIYVSIENGIIAGDNNESYCDIPVIQYKLPGADVKMINSSASGVIIPEQYRVWVEESLCSPGRSITFGSIIEKRLAIKDWHKFISGKSRKNIIRDSMEVEVEPEPEPAPVVKPKSKTLIALTQSLNRFGAFIDTKINEVKL
jgi:non-canonical (house-cleaning) NTP pyrophosphatase